MKKWLKILLGVIAALTLLIGALILIGDQLLRQGIETVGSQLLGTDVSVGHLRLRPSSGRLTIRDLRVANPPGCRELDALTIKKAAVTIDLATLWQQKLVIREIRVTGFAINFEPELNGSGNLGKLQQNVKKATGSEKQDHQSTGSDAVEERQVIIRHLSVTGTEVRVTALRQTLTLELPDLEMNDVGKESTLAETVDALFARMMLDVSTAWQQSSLAKKFQKQLNNVGQKAIDTLKRNSRKLEKEIRRLFR